MLDIHQIMSDLALRRPVFHSEADFQHALAWRIHETRPDCDIRLELEQFLAGAEQRMATDIWVRFPEATVAIELKYTTRALRQEWQREIFALRDHGAQPPRRYDFVSDVQRLEQTLLLPNPANYGFAILLTNTSMYWTPPTRGDIIDADFRIHDGHRVGGGQLLWNQKASAGTRRGREEPITLTHAYNLRWRDYSALGNRAGERFRYLAVAIPPNEE